MISIVSSILHKFQKLILIKKEIKFCKVIIQRKAYYKIINIKKRFISLT